MTNAWAVVIFVPSAISEQFPCDLGICDLCRISTIAMWRWMVIAKILTSIKIATGNLSNWEWKQDFLIPRDFLNRKYRVLSKIMETLQRCEKQPRNGDLHQDLQETIKIVASNAPVYIPRMKLRDKGISVIPRYVEV